MSIRKDKNCCSWADVGKITVTPNLKMSVKTVVTGKKLSEWMFLLMEFEGNAIFRVGGIKECS